MKANSVVSWRVFRGRSGPRARWVVGIAALGVLAFGSFVFRSPLLGIAGAAMILAATAENWLGVRYRLTDTHAEATVGFSRTAIAWADVKRIERAGNERLLSPLEKAGPLEPFRGVRLTVPAHDPTLGEEVERRLRSFAPHVEVA